MGSEIQILSETEAIRKNPGMYIGSIDTAGAHHLFHEVIHNSLDEAMLGYCNQIDVVLNGSTCQVSDNGRGIPTELHPVAGVSCVEVALTRLHAGSKFERGTDDFTTGIHGVGLSCVNALSSSLEVNVYRGGKAFQQIFRLGKAATALKQTELTKKSGTSVSFTPDKSIFKEFKAFDPATCSSFIEKLAHLNPGVTFTLLNEITHKKETFSVKAPALVELLKKTYSPRRELFPDSIEVKGSFPGFNFEGAFTWTAEIDSQILSFVNCVETANGALISMRSGQEYYAR